MQDLSIRYIKPYPQPVLGGELGLTLHEIADALGAAFGETKRKILRSSFLEMCKHLKFKVMTDVIINNITGLRVDTFVLDVNAAKAFVAKYDNKKGWGYLGFLISCEEAITTMIPALLKKVNELEAKLAALQAPKRVGGPKKALVAKHVTKIIDLFGGEKYYVTKERRDASSLTEAELLTSTINHITTVIEGLAERQRKLEDQLSFYQVQPTNQLVITN